MGKRAVRRGRRTTAEERSVILDQLSRSGLSVRAFARLHGLAASKLYVWRHRAARGGGPALAEATPVDAVSWVTVEPSDDAVQSPSDRLRVTIELRSGGLVHVPVGAAVDEVMPLVRALLACS